MLFALGRFSLEAKKVLCLWNELVTKINDVDLSIWKSHRKKQARQNILFVNNKKIICHI